MNAPPAECPIRIGGEPRVATNASRWSTIAPTVSSAMGDGSARSVSTSPSKPGYDGVCTVKPCAS